VTSIWQLPALIGAVVAWLSMPPTSLADAARREAVRRALMAPSSALYTNDDLPPLRPSDVPTAAAAPTPTPADASSAAQPPVVAGSPAAAAVDPFPVRDDEAAWRARTAELHDALDKDRQRQGALQSRVAALQRDVISRDDPAQRAALAQELAKALAELDRLAGSVQTKQAAIENFLDEARRRSVPPGWLRR
jgi:hypothetical protein